jgi:hypothetical protein
MTKSGFDGLSWLIENCPWKYTEGREKADVFAGVHPDHGPCIMILRDWWDGGWPDKSEALEPYGSFVIVGASIEAALQNAIDRARLLVEKRG